MIGKSFKVGILSMQRIFNYGSFLQGYGLKSILKELGCDVQFVDYHPGKCLIPPDGGVGIMRKISKVSEVFRYHAPLKEKIRFIRYKKNYAAKFYPYLEITNQMNYAPQLDLLVIGSDAAPYFESAMCAAVPLLHGAGVKVKVIEALSAGIPVLTNEIGIEGIPARNGEEFFLCRKPEEYANIIIRMLNDYTQFEDVSRKAKQLIEREYNLEESFCNYSRHIYELIQRKHE